MRRTCLSQSLWVHSVRMNRNVTCLCCHDYRCSLWTCCRIIVQGFRRDVSWEDVWKLKRDDRCETIVSRFYQHWAKNDSPKHEYVMLDLYGDWVHVDFYATGMEQVTQRPKLDLWCCSIFCYKNALILCLTTAVNLLRRCSKCTCRWTSLLCIQWQLNKYTYSSCVRCVRNKIKA